MTVAVSTSFSFTVIDSQPYSVVEVARPMWALDLILTYIYRLLPFILYFRLSFLRKEGSAQSVVVHDCVNKWNQDEQNTHHQCL
jgi:hypothetical protein